MEIVEGSSADLAEFVALQRLDMAMAMDVQPRRNMHSVPLVEEELMLVGKPVAGHGECIRLDEIARLPLLLPSFPNSVRVIADRAFVDKGLHLNLVAETSAVSVLLCAAHAGIGWTILPWSALADNANPGIVSYRILDAKLKRRVSLCTSSSARLSLSCRAVEEVLLGLVTVLVKEGKWLEVELIHPPG